MKSILSFIILLAACNCLRAQNTVFVKYNDPRIRYEGRIDKSDTSAYIFYWSGTAATINFSGSGISALLQDGKGENFYQIIVDNRPLARIQVGTTKQLYTLAQNLPAGKHKLQLFKRTEWEHGKTLFYGFRLAGGGKLLAPPILPGRKIEFYGNSITCGYANEDNVTGGDSNEGQYENNYLSYAAITARYFNAAYMCTARSGIGLTVSYGSFIMPEMYDRLNPADSASKWNFTSYKPQVVVIDLGENDASISAHPENDFFRARFGTQKPDAAFFIRAYQRFFRTIRRKYPLAAIICTLGDMSAVLPGSPWPGYVRQAVTGLHDRKMLIHFFKPKSGYGHPRVKDDQQMADDLIAFIKVNVRW